MHAIYVFFKYAATFEVVLASENWSSHRGFSVIASNVNQKFAVVLSIHVLSLSSVNLFNVLANRSSINIA